MLPMRKRELFPHLNVILLSLLCLIYLFFLTNNITLPWLGGHTGHAGKIHSLEAKNYLRYGYWNSKLVPIRNYGKNIPPQPNYHMQHPVLVFIVISLFMKIFGISAWATRLAPITFSLATLILIFYFVKKLWGTRAALFSAFFWTISPMTTFFGQLVNYEPQTNFLIILSTYLYWKWTQSNEKKSFSWFVLVYLLALLSDWPAFFLGYFLVIHYLLWHRKSKNSFLVVSTLILLPIMVFILFNLQHYLVKSQTLQVGEVSRQFQAADVFKRTFTMEEFVKGTIARLLRLYTWPVCFLSFAWFVKFLKNVRDDLNSQNTLILVFLLLGTIYTVVFKGGAWHHPFWSFYFAPFFAIASGVFAEEIWCTLKRFSTLTAWIVIGIICLFSTVQGVAEFKKMHINYASDKAAWNEYEFALKLAKNIPEGEAFISVENHPIVHLNVAFLKFYYTDRRVVFVSTQEELEEALTSFPKVSYILLKNNAALSPYITSRFKWKPLDNHILAYVQS